MSGAAIFDPADAAPGYRATLLDRRFAVRALALFAVAAAATAVLLGAGALGAWQHVIVSGHSMEPTLSPGDLVFAERQQGYAVGDVVVFRIPKGNVGAGVLVVHRIVAGSAERGYTLQGDNREFRDPWAPRRADIVGKVKAKVPKVGIVIAYARTVPGIAFIVGFVVFLFALGPLDARARARPRPLDRVRGVHAHVRRSRTRLPRRR